MTYYRYCIEWKNLNGRGKYHVVALDEKDARRRFLNIFPNTDLEHVTKIGEAA